MRILLSLYFLTRSPSHLSFILSPVIVLSQAKNGGLRSTGGVLAVYFEAKGHYHQACAELAIAKSDDVLEGFGAVIKRLHLAEEKCVSALALAKARATRVDDVGVLAQLAALSGDIAGVCGPAERANSSVYFENVDGATLAVIEGKILVKVEPYAMDRCVCRFFVLFLFVFFDSPSFVFRFLRSSVLFFFLPPWVALLRIRSGALFRQLCTKSSRSSPPRWRRCLQRCARRRTTPRIWRGCSLTHSASRVLSRCVLSSAPQLPHASRATPPTATATAPNCNCPNCPA